MIKLKNIYVFLISLCVVSACSKKDKSVGETCNIFEGDLVITEIMPNPIGDDDGYEWFEIFNVSGKEQILNQLILERLSVDDEGALSVVKKHPITYTAELSIESYFVLGDGEIGNSANVDYSYSQREDLGAFSLSGAIRLMCQDRIIDTLVYGQNDPLQGGNLVPEEGISISFDGANLPDPILNDKQDLWCNATQIYDDVGNKGTPGKKNNSCNIVACLENEVEREINPPTEGGIIISEILANPSDSDRNKEWVELYINQDITDLNALKIINKTSSSENSITIEQNECISYSQGEYVLIAFYHEDDRDAVIDNGGISPDIILYTSKDSFLFNGEIVVEISFRATVIDSANIPSAQSGASASLKTDYFLPTGNDITDNFCTSDVTGYFNDKGTPGLPNVCMVIETLECSDENGVLRSLNKPSLGDLVITEFHGDPESADNAREWIEIYSTASSNIDLNGLIIESTASSSREKNLESSDCIIITPQKYFVVGLENAHMDGVQADFVVSGAAFIYNSESTLKLLYPNEEEFIELDSTPPLDPTSGSSLSLGSGDYYPTTTFNDDVENWCVATQSLNGFLELGSPGIANLECIE